MPTLRRAENVELCWEERGRGPTVLICHPCFSVPWGVEALAEDLARDHRVVVYDPRGTGRSSRTGPWDISTDTGDLVALLEVLGAPSVHVSFGDAVHRSVEAASLRPELVAGVVSPGVTALAPRSAYGGVDEGLASSPAVVGALVQLLEADYRAGLRTVVEGGNPQMSEQEKQERVEAVMAYSPVEVTLARLRSWIGRDSREAARALGDRLWLLVFEENAWFPPALMESVIREVPDAHIEHVEGGAVSRPDLTAAIVRRLTGC